MRVKKIASGQHHTLILTECGKIYGTGDNCCYQLGVIHEKKERHAKVEGQSKRETMYRSSRRGAAASKDEPA